MATPAPSADALRRAGDVARLATFLDACIPIPGTPWRLGVESLLGLIPGLGDAIGLALGIALVHQAHQAGAPPPLLRRMAGNVALDATLGLVPILGDVLDVAFKSNQMNARLLLQHLGVEPPAPARRPWWLRVGVALLAVAAGVLLWRALR